MEGPINRQENLDIKVRIAGPEDWQSYRDLILEAIDSPDQEMFNLTPGEEESEQRKKEDKEKTEEKWRAEVSDTNERFVVLSFVKEEGVGMGVAMRYAVEDEKDTWKISFGYVKNKFRNLGIQKKIIEARLDEIKKRGGKKVVVLVKAHNAASIGNLEKFGFGKVRPTRLKSDGSPIGYVMVLELS